MKTFDFASGKKTLMGMALFLVPYFAEKLGYEITPESISALMEQVFTISGACLGLYGLVIKFVKGLQSTFTK